MRDPELERLAAVYRELEPGAIPWHFEDPPGEILEALDARGVAPGRTLELGCGAGVLAAALAARGHEVVAVDAVVAALALARARPTPASRRPAWVAADVRRPCWGEGSFELVVDWELLHHVPHRDRAAVAGGVARALRPGGLWVSVSFASDDRGIPGGGRVRRTPLGTVLYLSEPGELRALVEPWFRVEEAAAVTVRGRQAPHRAVRLVAVRR